MRFIYLGKRIRIGTEMPALLYVCAVSEGIRGKDGVPIAAALLGRRFNSATVSLSGTDISYSGVTSYKNDVLVCASGPFFSLAAAALTAFAAPAFSAVNAVLGLLNLVPAPCFDGGRVTEALFFSLFGSPAERACLYVHLISLFMLYLSSVCILFMTGANFSLLLVCAYVFAASYVRQDG